MKVNDLVIIGSGPGGMTAAIYGGRMNLDIVIVEKGAPGGKLLNTHLVENYPGYAQISGGQLATEIYNQMQDYKPEMEFDEVLEIQDADKSIKKVVLASGKTLQTRAIFISSGMSPKLIDVPKTEELLGKGNLSTCVICDGAFHRGKPIAMIGGGNSVSEETLFASTVGSHVYIINKFDELKAEKITLDKLKNLKNLTILNNSEVTEYIMDKKITGIKVFNSKENKTQDIDISGIFIYIGNNPNTAFAKPLGILNDYGFIMVDDHMKTKYDGIYAGGDVIEKDYRQITTSEADATIAALDITKYVDSLK